MNKGETKTNGSKENKFKTMDTVLYPSDDIDRLYKSLE